MLHCIRFHIVSALCLLVVAFCVNGFMLGRYSLCRRPSYPLDGERLRGSAILAQANRGILYEDENPNTIYPTETLHSIAINSTQTLAPNIAYFYLQNTLGLSEETMWKITLDAGSVLGMTPRNLEKKVSLLRRSMNLSDEDVRVILGKQPTLLHYSADRNLAPTILFLVRALDLSKSELRAMILDCPSILSYSLRNLRKKLHFFVFTLGYSDCGEKGLDAARELLVGTPKLLLAAVDTGLIPRMNFLLNEIQFSQTELRRLYEKNPRLLLYSLDDNLREKIVFFFILQLRMEPEHVRKILLSFPQVMDYNLKNHMKPIVNYFLSELDFSAAEFGSIIQKFPRVFSYSLIRIKHVIGFLRFELDLDPRQAKRVIFQAPQVFGLSNINEKLDCLRDHLHLSAKELGLVLSKMPTLMCLGVESNLVPKLNYLEHALLADCQSLKETILKQPTLLGYSLQGRIQPRMERLVAAGISPIKITVGISMTENNFQKWLSSSQSRKMTQMDLLKDVGFNDEELDVMGSSLPKLTDWKVPSLRSWINFLKRESGNSDSQLKNALLCCPMLLNSSGCRQVRHRLKKLRSAGLSLFDTLNNIPWSDDDFPTRSELAGVPDARTMSALITLPDKEFLDWVKQRSLVSLRNQFSETVEFLESTFDLNEEVADLLLPFLSNNETARVDVEKITNLLLSLTDGNVERVKAALLERPYLFSYSLSELENRIDERTSSVHMECIVDVVTMADQDYQTYLSLKPLQNILNLTQKEIISIVAGRRMAGNSTALTLATNIDYLLTQGFKDDVKNAILSQPKLLSYSLEKLQNEINERMELQAYLNLTDIELDWLVPIKAWLTQRSLRQGAKPNTQYLASHLNISTNDLKQLLLEEPKILNVSLLKTIQPRMAMLTEAGCPPTDIKKIASLSQRKADEYCTTFRVCRKLDISSIQIDRVFASFRNARPQPSSSLIEKVDYLLHHVFGGSEQKLKVAIIEEPTLLKKSLKHTIKPRAEVLHFLESFGLDHNPNDMASFFTEPESVFIKKLAPKVQNWHPIKPDKKRKGKDSKTETTMEENENDILATLKDFSFPPTTFVYSDESNRDGARVVHWR